MPGTQKNKSLRLHPEPLDTLDLSTKKLLVVGGTNGLGRAIAQTALSKGAEVTVVGRTLRDPEHPRLTFVQADLSSMAESVRIGRELAVEDIDVALFTSGIIAAKVREETAEGVERDVAVSYLNRVAVLGEIATRLGTARPADAPRPRVVVMGSPGSGELGKPEDLNSESDYAALTAHGNTVAGNEALALGADGRFPGPAYFGMGPGLIKTGIRENYLGRDSRLGYRLFEGAIGLFLQSPEKYATRMVPLLFTAQLEGRSGVLLDRRGRPVLPTKGFDEEHVRSWMDASAALLKSALSTTTP
jgi:NAD(P)-dependent dehydrogenase (short-subunit alcohol dehydrogenase family)